MSRDLYMSPNPAYVVPGCATIVALSPRIGIWLWRTEESLIAMGCPKSARGKNGACLKKEKKCYNTDISLPLPRKNVEQTCINVASSTGQHVNTKGSKFHRENPRSASK